MSGGALDYVYCRLDDAIKEIEKRVRENNKTLQQIWDEKSESEKESARECGYDWEIPWTIENHPNYVEQQAEDDAWEKCPGVKEEKAYGCVSRSLPTKKVREEWNRIRRESILSQIESHNNGVWNYAYSPETIETMKKMLDTIKRAKIYLQRIEWLLSGDDGESDLIECTKKDLKEVGLDADIR